MPGSLKYIESHITEKPQSLQMQHIYNSPHPKLKCESFFPPDCRTINLLAIAIPKRIAICSYLLTHVKSLVTLRIAVNASGFQLFPNASE